MCTEPNNGLASILASVPETEPRTPGMPSIYSTTGRCPVLTYSISKSQLIIEEYLKGPSSTGGKRLQVTASVCESNEQFWLLGKFIYVGTTHFLTEIKWDDWILVTWEKRLGTEQEGGKRIGFLYKSWHWLISYSELKLPLQPEKKRIKKKMKYSSCKGKRSVDAVRLCQSLSRSEPSVCGRFLLPLSPAPWAEAAG